MRRKESTAKFHHLDSLLVEPQLVHLLLYVCEPEAARMPMLLPGLMVVALRTCPCCCRRMDRDSGSIAAGAHAEEIMLAGFPEEAHSQKGGRGQDGGRGSGHTRCIANVAERRHCLLSGHGASPPSQSAAATPAGQPGSSCESFSREGTICQDVSMLSPLCNMPGTTSNRAFISRREARDGVGQFRYPREEREPAP